MAGPFVGYTGNIPHDQTTGALLVLQGTSVKGTAINGSGSFTTSGTPSTSTQLVAANAARVEIAIYHNGATGTVYFGRGVTAVVGAGDLITPGSPPLIITTHTGAINAISSVASVPLTYVEQ
jgi:hypothetical protein